MLHIDALTSFLKALELARAALVRLSPSNHSQTLKIEVSTLGAGVDHR
jgi:hypothetical protein